VPINVVDVALQVRDLVAGASTISMPLGKVQALEIRADPVVPSPSPPERESRTAGDVTRTAECPLDAISRCQRTQNAGENVNSLQHGAIAMKLGIARSNHPSPGTHC
jgi:hypothetical protein